MVRPNSRGEFIESLIRVPNQGPPHYFVVSLLENLPTGELSDELFLKYVLSPGDPTLLDANYLTYADPSGGTRKFFSGGPTSYGFNSVGFEGPISFPAGLTDGTSNTIAYSEKYYQGKKLPLPAGTSNVNSWMMFAKIDAAFADFSPNVLNNLGERRPSFADAGWGDVLPVTDPITNVTRASVAGKTFQVKPKPDDADMTIPQTPFSAGLPVAMFDGSVRTIRPGVSEHIFWSAVTPRGGEVAPLD